jgi:hypothetical protein
MEAGSKRGIALTVFAVLFVLLAIEDILKPFKLEGPQTGLVFFGHRLAGTADAIMGPLFGILLLIYAAGIWRMRRYALYIAFGYAIYVILNLALATVYNPPPATHGEFIFDLAYTVLAVVLTWAVAFLLRAKRTELT